MSIDGYLGSRKDAHYAVVVGIDKYFEKDILNPLSGVVGDVAGFIGWLLRRDGGGLNEENIRAVTTSDVSVDYLTKFNTQKSFKSKGLGSVYFDHISDALRSVNEEMKGRLESGLDPSVFDRSRIYIFLAGHGLMSSGVEAALLCSNARKGAWGAGFEIGACAGWYLNHGPFHEVIIFADCCRTKYDDVNLNGMNFDKYKLNVGRRLILKGFANVARGVSWEVYNGNQIRGAFSNALEAALRDDVEPVSKCLDNKKLESGVGFRVRQQTSPPNPPPIQNSTFQPVEFEFDDHIYFGGGG
jgi:hypothetical protein